LRDLVSSPDDLNEVHFTGNYLGGVRMSIGEILDSFKKDLTVKILGSSIFIYKPLKNDGGFSQKLNQILVSIHLIMMKSLEFFEKIIQA
jgi:radical SAM superfamily enzyme with C-terminal helix-hairpin-helix motif